MQTLMPASPVMFAAVAACLAGIDPLDRGAVSRFYRRLAQTYPPSVRALIADFLIGLSGPPADGALERLKRAVAGAQTPRAALRDPAPFGLDGKTPSPRRRRPSPASPPGLPAATS